MTKKDVKRQALQMYISGVDTDKIANTCQLSERTVYRYIKEYDEGKSNVDVSKTVSAVKKFREQELEDLLDILKSTTYIDKIAMVLDNITEVEVQKELGKNGLRGVTVLFGTMVDKRLKSYTVEMERENLKLKKKLASNHRVIQFIGEEPVYELDNKLPQDNTKNIS